jgi:hypothetical protein
MLSKTIELLETITGRKIAPVSVIDKGQKLTQGADGVWLLEPDLERFVKSATVPVPKAELAKAILTHRHIVTAGGSRALDAGFRKRAVHVAVTEAQMREGTAPTVGATPPPAEAGLSDENIRALENAIAASGLSPAAAEKLLAQILAIPLAGRKPSVTDDSYGIPYEPGVDAFGNSAKVNDLVKAVVKAAVDTASARMNTKLRTTTLTRDAYIAADDPNAVHKSLVATLRAGGRSILNPAFHGTMGG